jgi:hypothetical protein
MFGPHGFSWSYFAPPSPRLEPCFLGLVFFPIAQVHGKARNAPSAKTNEQARRLALDVTNFGYPNMCFRPAIEPSVLEYQTRLSPRYSVSRDKPLKTVKLGAFRLLEVRYSPKKPAFRSRFFDQ